jgi:predicted permease
MSILRRLWFFLHRRRLEVELRQEMESHLEARTGELIEEGMDPRRARDAALRAFGNPLHQREESRDAWGFVWLDLLLQDVRHAGRALFRQPLLSVIAILSLGLSMAAACAVFSLADTTLVASLPVPRPSALVVLRWASGPTTPYESLDGWSGGNDHENWSTSFSVEAFGAAQARASSRAEVFAFARLYQLNVAVEGSSELASGQMVSGNYFAALGVRPAFGRLLGPADDRRGAQPSAVVSYAFWQRRFGGRADIVGAGLLVNGTPTVVVGVAPRGFDGTGQVGETADIHVPMMLRERFLRRDTSVPGQAGADEVGPFDPRYWWLNVMARLTGDTTPAQLQPELERAIRATVDATRTDAGQREPFRVFLDSGRQGLREMRAELVQPLGIMAAIVALVIVVACANLATLFLARGAARDHELAVRHALGASRARLVRALMLESCIIGLAGGLVGLLGAPWVGPVLAPALALGPNAPVDGGVTWSVLFFASAAAIATALLFGLIPAWRGTDIRATARVNAGIGRVAHRVPRLRTARAILIFQVAMSLVVVVAAVLLVGTLRNLQRVEPGFDPRNVLLCRVDLSLTGHSTVERRRALSEILERLRVLPGVQAVSLSDRALLSGSAWIKTVRTTDSAALSQPLMVNRLNVDDGFFRTMHIPVLAGTVAPEQSAEAASIQPAVVSRAFALRAFGSIGGAIGRHFSFDDRPRAHPQRQPDYEVVGVVEDVRVARLREPPPPTAYFSYLLEPMSQASFAVRTAGTPTAVIAAVRQTVTSVAPDVAMDRFLTQSAQIAERYDRERLFAALASALGALTLFLACIGIYGLMAYAVSRRTTEIGVRLAVGARPSSIVGMVLAEAGRIVAIGAGLGLGAGFFAARYLGSVLFGLRPTEPGVLAGGVGLLVIVAAAAAFIPARRAAHIDPLAALRHE